MNPDERQMISGLFDRMRQQGTVEKDRDAEALIRDSVRQMPDAPYMMVQSVLVQEMALQHAQSQIQELEDRVHSLEAQARPQQSSGGSFLGGLFGGGSKPAAVPSTGAPRQSGGFSAGAAPVRPGSPWSQQAQPQGGMPMQGNMQGGMPMQQQAAGGGFMKTAMATAAGVAGGMLAANAISNMMKGDSAQAATPASGSGQAGGNDPSGSYQLPDEGNDPAGSYQQPAEEPSYDDGGSWSSDE